MDIEKNLSREYILSLPAGRELDALVAEKVMGYKIDKYRPGLVSKGGQSTYPKRYSTDISAAYQAEAKAIETNKTEYAKMLLTLIKSSSQHPHPIELSDSTARFHMNMVSDIANASPEIRCKAALLAVIES